MSRAPEQIAADEALYRRLRSDWVQGHIVLPEAIDLGGTSVDRSKYRTEEQSLGAGRPGETGLATIRACDLPTQITLSDGDWEWFEHDDPNPPTDPENDAHAELRPRPHRRRKVKRADKATKPPIVDRQVMKAALANRFRICVVPM
jgi:hypothetical protein